MHRSPDQRGTERKDAALHRDQRRQRVVTHRAGVRAARNRYHREPERGNDHSHPLPATEVKAEVTFREHGEKHQPARQQGLHDRQRRQRKRPYMEPPRSHRHRPPQREPAGAEQAHRAAQRVTRPHRGRQHRTTLFEEKSDVRAQRRGQRQRHPSNHRPIFSGAQTAATERRWAGRLDQVTTRSPTRVARCSSWLRAARQVVRLRQVGSRVNSPRLGAAELRSARFMISRPSRPSIESCARKRAGTHARSIGLRRST
jgi:hypothetical protein